MANSQVHKKKKESEKSADVICSMCYSHSGHRQVHVYIFYMGDSWDCICKLAYCSI